MAGKAQLIWKDAEGTLRGIAVPWKLYNFIKNKSIETGETMRTLMLELTQNIDWTPKMVKGEIKKDDKNNTVYTQTPTQIRQKIFAVMRASSAAKSKKGKGKKEQVSDLKLGISN